MEAAAARNSAARNSTARSSLGSLRAILSAVLPRSSALQVNGVFQFNITKGPGGKGATYHQDSSEHGSDRVGELQFWLACDSPPHPTLSAGPLRECS